MGLQAIKKANSIIKIMTKKNNQFEEETVLVLIISIKIC